MSDAGTVPVEDWCLTVQCNEVYRWAPHDGHYHVLERYILAKLVAI